MKATIYFCSIMMLRKDMNLWKKNQLKIILFLWNWIGGILAPKFALLTKSGCHQTESPGFKCGILINLSLNKGYKRNVENKYQICPAEMSKLMYLPTKRTFKKEVSQSMLFALYFFYLKKRRWAMQNHDFQNPATQSFWGRAYLDRADFFRLGLKYLSIKNRFIMGYYLDAILDWYLSLKLLFINEYILKFKLE